MPDQTITQPVEIDFARPLPDSLQAPVPAVAQHQPQMPQIGGGDPFLMMIERAASDPRVDIDKMDRLLQMKERRDAHAAQIEYDRAMADAQKEMAPIRADLENKQTKSRYASYAQLDAAIRPIYSAHGFALSFDTGDAPQPTEVRILCTVSHRGGHREGKRIDMPADGKGPQGAAVMTRTHATGAAASYGQRYLLKLIFNLAVGDVDDDGNGAGGMDADVENLGTGPRDPATGKLLSTYDVAKNQRAKDIADRIVQAINLAPNRELAKEIWAEEQKIPPKKRQSPLGWLQDNAPGQFHRCQTAYENVVGLE